jgi:hypothetical protein
VRSGWRMVGKMKGERGEAEDRRRREEQMWGQGRVQMPALVTLLCA